MRNAPEGEIEIPEADIEKPVVDMADVSASGERPMNCYLSGDLKKYIDQQVRSQKKTEAVMSELESLIKTIPAILISKKKK